MAPKVAKPAQTGKKAATRDWNLVWASRNLADLSSIPIHNYGYCGCELCGKRKSVKGSTFVTHMRELHGPKLSSTKRARTTSNTPGPSTSALSSAPAFVSNAASTSGSRQHDDIAEEGAEQDFGMDVSMEAIAEEALEEAAEEEMTEEAAPSPSIPPPVATPGLLDLQDPSSFEAQQQVDSDDVLSDETIRRALESMLEHSATDSNDFVPLRPSTPEPLEDVPASLPPGSFNSAPLPQGDILDLFPVDLPLWMKQPIFSGARPNPHVANPPEATNTPLFQRAFPLLAHTLSSLYGVARRPINLALQVANIVVRNAENRLYQRFRQWYIAQHPQADPTTLDALDSFLNPAYEAPAAPNTLDTALRRIGVNNSTIVHPTCPNRDCFEVFYAVTNEEGFNKLPARCPMCETPLYNSQRLSAALHFARRTLKDELEAVLGVQGVEASIVQRDARKQTRNEEDDRAGGQWGKVYRQQDDGSAWGEQSDAGSAAEGALQLTVNLSVDWANQSSKRSAATNSIGPIILQLADVPAQLRSSFACTMVMGITPGPKAPRSSNLWKLLLPLAMELRDSQANGLWLQTPQYPEGRLVYVRLGLIVCDRPAACEVTGAGHFTNRKTPCLRCTIQTPDIIDVAAPAYPLRDFRPHARAIFDQIRTLPAALEAHRTAFVQEQKRLVDAGTIAKAAAYTKKMAAQAIEEHNVYPGNVSALGVIPGYDKFGNAIFDPMHSLLEGLLKTYFHKVLIAGKHGSAGDEEDKDRTGENGLDSAAETTWGSDGEAASAHAVADRVIGAFEQGSVAVPTTAEVAILRRGVQAMGKTARTRNRRLGDAGVQRLQHLLADVSAPSSIPRLHPEFGSPSAGTPTASHWRSYASVFGPLTLPLLFHERGRMGGIGSAGNPHLTPTELRAMMLLFELIALALRPTTSDAVLNRLGEIISTFLGLAFSLHPSLSKSTNFHVITHLTDDIRRFGPATGWWTFPTERVNYVIKNVNQSGANRYRQGTIGLRGVVRAKQMVSARVNALKLPETATAEDKELAQEIEDTFDAFHHDSAVDTLEQIALRFSEIDRLSIAETNAFSSRDVHVQPRGTSQERTLDDTTLAKLQHCLSQYGEATRSVLDIVEGDPAHPYLPSRAIFWQGVTFAGRRLDSAEWGKPLQVRLDSNAMRDLVRSRNGLFESRREEHILACNDRRVISGVLCAVFEHRATGSGALAGSPRLYGIVRKFRSYEGEDSYGFRLHPSLNVWLWQHEVLEDPVVLWLNPSTLHSMRPLAMTELPISPSDRGVGSVWATIPVPYQ